MDRHSFSSLEFAFQGCVAEVVLQITMQGMDTYIPTVGALTLFGAYLV